MESRYVEVADKKIHYMLKGQGQPLVLLHGLGSSLLQWQKNIQELSKHFAVYAFDFPGFGQSDPAEEDEVSMAYIPLFMRDLMETLKIEDPILVGGSFGGLIAMHYTIRYPDKVKKLVLMDSAGLGIETSLQWRLATLPLVGEIFAVCDSFDIRDQDSWLWKTVKLPLVGNKIEHLRDKLLADNTEIIKRDAKNSINLLRHGVDPIGQKMRIIGIHKLKNKLKEHSVQVLIMWGSKDRVFPLSHAYRAASVIPNARLHIFEGAHHWPAVEEDFSDEFNRVLIEFASS